MTSHGRPWAVVEMKDFRSLSADVKVYEKGRLEKVTIDIPPDEGMQFEYREGLKGELTFKALLAEVKKLEKIAAASRYAGLFGRK